MDADALKARVLAAAAARPSPTRSEGRKRVLAMLLVSVALALGLFQAAGGMDHSAGRPLSATVLIAGGWGLFTALLSCVVLWRGRSTMGRAPIVVLLAALITPITLVAWVHFFHGSYVEPFSRVGWRCGAYHLVMAVLPMTALIAYRRGSEPRHPWALGAAIGALCGAWAGELVDLWCPLTNLPHLLVGHVVPLVLLIAAGALLGSQMLGVKLERGATGARSTPRGGAHKSQTEESQ